MATNTTDRTTFFTLNLHVVDYFFNLYSKPGHKSVQRLHRFNREANERLTGEPVFCGVLVNSQSRGTNVQLMGGRLTASRRDRLM